MKKAILLFALITLIATACAGAARRQGQVLVYVVAPLSGWQANGGQTVVGGVRTMADQLNRQGGLLGYTVKIVADSTTRRTMIPRSNKRKKSRAAIKQGKKVIGVIGHLNSGQTLAAMQDLQSLAARRHHAHRVRSVADQAGLSQLFPRQRDRRRARSRARQVHRRATRRQAHRRRPRGQRIRQRLARPNHERVQIDERDARRDGENSRSTDTYAKFVPTIKAGATRCRVPRGIRNRRHGALA